MCWELFSIQFDLLNIYINIYVYTFLLDFTKRLIMTLKLVCSIQYTDCIHVFTFFTIYHIWSMEHISKPYRLLISFLTRTVTGEKIWNSSLATVHKEEKANGENRSCAKRTVRVHERERWEMRGACAISIHFMQVVYVIWQKNRAGRLELTLTMGSRMGSVLKVGTGGVDSPFSLGWPG